MARNVLLSWMMLASLGIGEAWAHHTAAGRMHPAVATVRITQPVLAGGKPLAPGTYEIVVNDATPELVPARPTTMQRGVEFVQNGTVVATEIAEVFPASERPIGTSGAGKARAVVQNLKSGDFVRVAITGSDARYLIHLPTGTAPVQP